MSTYEAAEQELYLDDRGGSRGANLSPTTIGYGAMALGLVLIAITWFQIRDIQNSAAQIPYIVSGGLTGIGAMVVGSIAAFSSKVELDGDSRRELRDLRAKVAALTETSEWTADAVEQIAGFLNEQAATETTGRTRKAKASA